MRFLAGLRLILVAAALIGLLAGRGVMLPVTAAHATVAMAISDSGHDCCGKTSKAPAEKIGLAGNCLGPGCSMVAPALLPASPVIALVAERSVDAPIAIAGLEGRSPPPLLEPPRA